MVLVLALGAMLWGMGALMKAPRRGALGHDRFALSCGSGPACGLARWAPSADGNGGKRGVLVDLGRVFLLWFWPIVPSCAACVDA